jgi:hypothetical protein
VVEGDDDFSDFKVIDVVWVQIIVIPHISE